METREITPHSAARMVRFRFMIGLDRGGRALTTNRIGDHISVCRAARDLTDTVPQPSWSNPLTALHRRVVHAENRYARGLNFKHSLPREHGFNPPLFFT